MKNKIFIITGRPGIGKTTFLHQLIQELKLKGIEAAGILSEGFWELNVRSRFELVDLTTGHRILFCTRDEHPGWEKVGHFYVNPHAMFFGEDVLQSSGLLKSPIIAIDEIGPLELNGKGWSKAIENLTVELPQTPLIVVVRSSLLQAVIDHFRIESFEILQAVNENLNESVCKIISAIKGTG
jgi:nucleoside-triphosphatase THEP1